MAVFQHLSPVSFAFAQWCAAHCCAVVQIGLKTDLCTHPLTPHASPFVQAMDRAHRLGQRRTVNVYRLLVRGSLEEHILGLQVRVGSQGVRRAAISAPFASCSNEWCRQISQLARVRSTFWVSRRVGGSLETKTTAAFHHLHKQ